MRNPRWSVRAAEPLADRARARSGAPYQHAPLEELLVDGAHEREAGDGEAGERESARQAHDAAADVQARRGVEDQGERDLGDRHRDDRAARTPR